MMVPLLKHREEGDVVRAHRFLSDLDPVEVPTGRDEDIGDDVGERLGLPAILFDHRHPRALFDGETMTEVARADPPDSAEAENVNRRLLLSGFFASHRLF